MTHKHILMLSVVFVAVLIVGTIAYLRPPVHTDPDPLGFGALAEDVVTSIAIVTGTSTRTIKHEAGIWSEDGVALDATTVTNYITLAQGASADLVSRRPDDAVYGLAAGGTKLIFVVHGVDVTYHIGSKDVRRNGVYVRRNTDPYVYLVRNFDPLSLSVPTSATTTVQ